MNLRVLIEPKIPQDGTDWYAVLDDTGTVLALTYLSVDAHRISQAKLEEEEIRCSVVKAVLG
jgi:uncharacterized protein YfdQ (DUF2303 family)